MPAGGGATSDSSGLLLGLAMLVGAGAIGGVVWMQTSASASSAAGAVVLGGEKAPSSTSEPRLHEPSVVLSIEGPTSTSERTECMPLVVGRAATADVVLPDAEVSRHHIRIKQRTSDGVIVVEDLGSRNGVFMNDRKLDHANFDVGSTVRIGATRITRVR